MVSIKLVINEGIIAHTKGATENYTVEEEKELIKIGYSDYKMQDYDISNRKRKNTRSRRCKCN